MVKKLMNASRPLTVAGLLMIPVLAAAVAGLVLDPRVITGAPAWLKPAKFAASIAIYSLTLAWIFSLMPGWPRMRRIVGRTTASVLVLEMAIIAFQAFRGTTSHYNIGTPFDAALFGIMGVAILVQTFSSIAVAVALFRTELADRALGWALRIGMVITILGAFTGGLMTSPTSQQIAEARAGQGMPVSGAHTVGGPDGGPGVPGTGWSTTHGDLRVPHFVGLHALQILPVIAFVLSRRRMEDVIRTRLLLAAAASYATLFVLLLWQALHGVSVFAPDSLSVSLFAAWALMTVIVGYAASASRRTVTVRLKRDTTYAV